MCKCKECLARRLFIRIATQKSTRPIEPVVRNGMVIMTVEG